MGEGARGPHASGRRPDGSPYEFSSVTTMVYAGGGRFAYQEDVYNFEETREVMGEWAKAHGKG
jgi:hypothetical protein